MTDDEQAIRDLMNTWMAASLAGDTKTVLELIADDVVFLTTGRPPFGKREFAAGGPPYRLVPRQQVHEVEVSGDLAFARSRLEVAVTPKEGANPIHLAGETLSVFRREEGGWRLCRDSNFLVPVKV
jgi:uncharacterized protein (TIGR02246 family)